MDFNEYSIDLNLFFRIVLISLLLPRVVDVISVPLTLSLSLAVYAKLFLYAAAAQGLSFIPKLSTARRKDVDDDLLLLSTELLFGELLSLFVVVENNLFCIALRCRQLFRW